MENWSFLSSPLDSGSTIKWLPRGSDRAIPLISVNHVTKYFWERKIPEYKKERKKERKKVRNFFSLHVI
jgi:hypothetical protein